MSSKDTVEDDEFPDWTPDNEFVEQRVSKVEELRRLGLNPFANGFVVDDTAVSLFSRHGDRDHDSLEEDPTTVSVAGRVRFCRRMGKATFLKIQDWTVRDGIKPPGMKRDGEQVPPTDDFLQLFLKANIIGADGYALCKSLDLGDIIGVRGSLMRTNTGELSVSVAELVLLTKSLRPLPDKWHGLSDVEKRFRQRYVDFAVNPRAREIIRIRSETIRLMRNFFNDRGFIEVETPILHSTPGGAAARPFATHHNALDLDLYLRIAPELYLKRLLVGGLGRVFELGRVFRNEGLSRQHNPEFTMVEFYQAYATYEDLMDLTEELLSSLVESIHGGSQLEYDGKELDFSRPWRRCGLAQLVAEELGLDEELLGDRAVLEEQARRLEIPKIGEMADGKLLAELFDVAVEPKLIQPTFVTHYPLAISPLSRRNDVNPELVDRFELFVSGFEIANAFSELNDPIDQYERFQAQLKDRAAGDDEAHPMDEDYVCALEYGMPPAAGQGIGIDRLVMLLTNSTTIREVIPFPLLRPEEGTTRQPG